jgi:hypothetical protein
MNVADTPPPAQRPNPFAHAAQERTSYGRLSAIYGLRARALLVAVPLLIGISLISVYADMVAKSVQFGVLQLAPPAVVALFIVALLNRAVRQFTRREWLNQADVLVIYAMLLVGVMVSTRGVIEKLIPPLAYLPYYASRENKLNEYLTQHLPPWAVPFTPTKEIAPPPELIRGYFEGVSPGQPVPYGTWIAPLLAWFALVGCVIFVFACLATILRRQWMDNEQLRFPLTALPLAIIRDDVEGEPFFTNRVMWAGFALAAVVFGINGLSANFPEWPRFVLDLRLNAIFTERPWNAMDLITLYVSLAAVGFAFFLPVDLLFSLWFFFLLTRLQDVMAVQLGGLPRSIGTHPARVWTGYQAAGAYFALILAQLRIGWPYFKQVWQSAFGKVKPLDDSDELMSYRAAILGLGGGFAGIVLWLTLAGMNPLAAAAQMGIYIFFLAIIMSRSVNEAGLLMTETSFRPTELIKLIYPLPHLSAVNLTMMSMMDIVFIRDLRGVLLSPLMDNQKMAGELRMRQRSLLPALAIAVVIAFVVASYFFLRFHYTMGGLKLYGYPNSNALSMFTLATGAIKGSTEPPDATAYGGFALGMAATALMVWMRANFVWFPLHPLAYAIAPTWTLYVFWFPFFIAWMIKSLVLHFGGIELFRRIAPFMLGMILGEFTMAVFWAIISMTSPTILSFKFTSAPGFPWP